MFSLYVGHGVCSSGCFFQLPQDKGFGWGADLLEQPPSEGKKRCTFFYRSVGLRYDTDTTTVDYIYIYLESYNSRLALF